MAHSPELKSQAYQYYVFDNMAMTPIATMLGVSLSTVRRWKSDDRSNGKDWDKARTAQLMAGQGMEHTVSFVVEQFVMQAQSTMTALKTRKNLDPEEKAKILASLADSINKLVASSKRIAPKISELGVAQDVLQRLLEFVRSEFPEHGQAFSEVIEPFGNHLIEVYS